jgi:hypothetical protein
MRLTKTDMARVIVMVLHGKADLPPVDSWEVQRRVRQGTVASLTRQHKLALEAIDA